MPEASRKKPTKARVTPAAKTKAKAKAKGKAKAKATATKPDARPKATKIMTKSASTPKQGSASRLIDGRIQELGDWRGKTLAQVRAMIKEVDPEVLEEWKWRGVPVWSHDGIICTGESYKSVVKLTFAKGAALEDPSRLFNSSLEGNTRRAIDFHEGEKIDEKALKALFRAAVTLNTSQVRGKSGRRAKDA
jgi:hypothetical protein